MLHPIVQQITGALQAKLSIDHHSIAAAASGKSRRSRWICRKWASEPVPIALCGRDRELILPLLPTQGKFGHVSLVAASDVSYRAIHSHLESHFLIRFQLTQSLNAYLGADVPQEPEQIVPLKVI